jgi:hypothetical protein
MNVGIVTEAMQFIFLEYMFLIFVIVSFTVCINKFFIKS